MKNSQADVRATDALKGDGPTTRSKALCLNMIVRNEMANLERCLSALADHIACWVIGDTGSTDGTQEFVRLFFATRDIPGELHSFPFNNFEQARNTALDCAYASALDYDYLLFADADMELVVDDQGFRSRLEAPGYRVLQRPDSRFAYWNTRIVQRSAGARYHGVTHEYLDVPGGVQELHGVWYMDHASGSNRVDKFERDIKLLTEALEQDPDNQRSWFYLANSLRDAGRTSEAATAYAKRAEMGGWDEEAWSARLQEARCLRKLGDEGGFVRQSLTAFNQRPQRVEPLYDLARFYREKGMNDASILFSEAGLGMPRPAEDVLFLEDFVYTAGLREEYSIAANYAGDPLRKDRGFAACNWLALNREIPAGSRDLARSNLFFYLQPARTMMPSFTAHPLKFSSPDGFWPASTSIARQGQRIILVQGSTNHRLSEDGRYEKSDDAPLQSRNFLLDLSDELAVQSAAEILAPVDMPQPRHSLVLGFHELRLFAWREELWVSGCVRELNPEGWSEQVLARIDERGAGRLIDWRVLHAEGPRSHEKNWVPRIIGESLQFIYRCDPTRVVDEEARTIFAETPTIAAERFSGGSQAIAFDGGWLALIHEIQVRQSDQRRSYQHRFVWFGEAGPLRRVSRPFYFHDKGIERAAGLAWHPDGKRLLVSYGVADQEAWIATVDAVEVQALLEDVDGLSSGTLGVGGGPRHGSAPRSSETAPVVTSGKDEGDLAAVAAKRAVPKAPDQTAFMQSEKAGPRLATSDLKSATERVFTCHGTVLYVDPSSGELLHGPVHDSPANASFVANGGKGQIVHEEDGSRAPIACLASRSLAIGSQGDTPHSYLPTQFDVVHVEAGRVALKAQGRYLCAEPDGRLTLSRSACGSWESFRVSGPLAEESSLRQAGSNSQQITQHSDPVTNRSPARLFTSHRTVVYVDALSGELRHGPVQKSPENAFVVAEGTQAQILSQRDGRSEPTTCSSDRCETIQPPDSSAPTVFEVVQLDRGSLGLKAHGKFLCAEPDGRLTLSRSGCSTWETFHVFSFQESRSPDELFMNLAPFLSAADSPGERRRMSRDFDARIAPFLDHGGPLPQIHCFYEVLSETARHQTLIASTRSMRACGHAVRVWSYSPQKLDFLVPHGIEVANAADVMPRRLFQRIVAGAEIRYFSDIFRYAVLYEHGGLWMDSDVILLRPFPFRGDHFFNLQWRGAHTGHFVCGNVIFARPYSRHVRNLYETSIERFERAEQREFGDIGPKLLSDYIGSAAGAELRESLFSPMFFNAIDWTELDKFDTPITELAEFLNDERVFGIHLWTARNNPPAGDEALVAFLSDPGRALSSFTDLADRFNTDKNRHSGNGHFYARIYDRLLSRRRLSVRRIMEIGLCRGLAEGNQTETPSVTLWQSYFPYCEVIGVDLTDFSALNNERFRSFVCDQSKLDDLRTVAAQIEPGSLDIIIDDGSHASYDEQLTLREFFPLLAPGGWYFIEDLDWQPPGEDASTITLTKDLLREIKQFGAAESIDPLGVSELFDEVAEILFFDSHYELQRANLLGGLVAIRKRGGTNLLG